MMLSRIEVVRYGRLRDATLGDLGGGLTVVIGPNEAGKSTFTALVRHVLYGYPTAQKKEAGYYVAGEGRLARLVFSDDDGVWVVERAEGTHGGQVRVRTVDGLDRPGLLADVTRGLSSTAYQVVFGFGLDEMARIEELHGSGESVIAPLYAASAGLGVSPHVVRAALEREAAELFKPSGRKPAVNALASEMRAVRGEIRALRQQADTFRADQERLTDLAGRLEEARRAREHAQARATELALASKSAETQIGIARDLEKTLVESRRARADAAGEMDSVDLDEALLEAAPELDALLDAAVLNARDMEMLAEATVKRDSAGAEAQSAVGRTGLDIRNFERLPADHVLTAAIEEARDDLQRLTLAYESRAEEAARTAESRDAADRALVAALAPIGIDPVGAGEEIAERLCALDELEQVRGGAMRAGSSSSAAVTLLLAVAGLAALIGGALLRQWLSVGVGAVVLAAGLWLLWRGLRGTSAAGSPDERRRLEAAGVSGDAGTVEVSRARRALENTRQLVTALSDAEARRAEAERDATLARDALATRRTLWAEWLREHGFDPTLAPTAAAQVVALAREARSAARAEAAAREEVARIEARLEAFAGRLADAARPHLDIPETLERHQVGGVVNRLRERLVEVRAAASRRAELAHEIGQADSRIAVEEQRLATALQELAGILERFHLTEGGTHDDLRALLIAAERDALEASTAFDALAEEKNQLEGRLENGADERHAAELSLAEAGLSERIADATDRYLVLSCAARLLSGAQERYERERQPEVVRSAQRIFERMTRGRYTGLSVPLAGERIEVFGARAEAMSSDILSRGTAEQLYLALRLGLIAELGEVGAGLPVLMDDVLANFDPERRLGAAEAITELAAGRQVVFFTCHPETARLFAEVAPDHTRIELSRCEL